MTYVRLAVLLVSYWGYYRALCVWTRMERTFIPMFVLSAQAVLIFLAGLAGGMYPMACALYFGGCAALAGSLAFDGADRLCRLSAAGKAADLQR